MRDDERRTRRRWTGARALAAVAAALLLLAVSDRGEAQEASRRELARELARLMVDETVRRGLEERVTTGMMEAVAARLQERLGRRLIEAEWRMLGEIVRRFVADTFPPSRIEEIAAESYARHFDEGELRDILRFQQSPAGRKVTRLLPVIASDTAGAIDGELRNSAALPGMVEALQQTFPVLRSPESR